MASILARRCGPFGARRRTIAGSRAPADGVIQFGAIDPLDGAVGGTDLAIYPLVAVRLPIMLVRLERPGTTGGTMVRDDLLLEAGTRLLHLGPNKTGTTAIQGAFHVARERLAAHGVVYAGPERQPLLAALAVTGQPALRGGLQPDMAHWKELACEVGDADGQRVVVSSEFLAGADDAAARRIIEDLGGSRVHVVVTLRPLTRVLP